MAAVAKKPTSQVLDVITINDITTQILTNAEVVFPREKGLKVVTGQASTGLIHYTSILAEDQKGSSVHKEWNIILQGPGEKDRRSSMMKLLEETEKRVAKQVMKK